jgi:hypothetical protein
MFQNREHRIEFFFVSDNCDVTNPSRTSAISAGMTETILYYDRYVSLTENTLTVHKYHFPFGTPKTIDRSDVADLKVTEMKWYETKTWGMAFSNVWWALDWSRNNPFVGTNGTAARSARVQVNGERFATGFSVENRDEFMRCYKNVVDGRRRAEEECE